MNSQTSSCEMTIACNCAFRLYKGIDNHWRMRMLLATVAVAALAIPVRAELPPIIPNPVKMSAGEGKFAFTAQTTIDADKSLSNEAQFLAALLKLATGAAPQGRCPGRFRSRRAPK